MIERIIERLIFACRWLLVPLYLGLAVLLLVFAAKAGMEVFKLFVTVTIATKKEIIVAILSMIDMVLVANLLVTVMLSSYETFVSRIDLEEGVERPAWMGKVDASMIKIKVLMSIVAISSIHLLEVYINIEKYTQQELLWLAIIQAVFVVSALLAAYANKIAFAHDH